MSSACVCHLNEFCFYCEVYSPLEGKYNNLTTAIRGVITALGSEADNALESATNADNVADESYDHGRANAYSTAMRLLKAVIASETGDTRKTSAGSQDDTTEQIQE